MLLWMDWGHIDADPDIFWHDHVIARLITQSAGEPSNHPIRTNLRAQQPSGESFKQKLSGVGMLFALIHITTGAHATSDRKDSIMKGAIACESFDEGKTAIADHLSELSLRYAVHPAMQREQ